MKSLRRPKSITFFAVLLFLTPLLTITANAYINMLPLWGAGSIFRRLIITDILILLVYPVAAVSVFSVTRAGWWLFIVSAVGVAIYNIIAYINNPMISLFGVIIFNLLLFITAGFFFRKHIIAPYFNPRLRWWEQASRYDIELGVSLEFGGTYEIGYLEDISIGGCFIRISENIKVGSLCPLRLSLGNEISISVKGIVMRSVTDDCSLPGYGVMFKNLTETEKEGLENMLSILHRLGLGETEGGTGDEDNRMFERYSVNVSVSFRYRGEILPARLINFSTTGACIETMLDMDMGEFCGFYCMLGYNSADVDGIIKWKKTLEHHRHYGIAFINPTKKQKHDITELLGTIKALGGRVRPRDVKAYDDMVEKTLPGTPYRIFQRGKKSDNT
ncbi:MAG: PilZ domain-containing protein [Spirochaetales bacterium]|nr:PilZ domain-containing protein [Spirochaetales bacterium]